MERVNSAEVKEIMDNCTTPDATVEAMITAANQIVNNVFGTTTHTDELLIEIEKWLSAHMVASTVFRMASDEKVGDASVKYTGQWGKRLESTPYGQMVLLLDTSGKMANTGKMAASIYAVKGEGNDNI